MSKIISLCKNYEFQRLYRKGKSSVKPTMVVYIGKGIRQNVRLGITASKKLGCAVIRNRAKRRIREIFRILLPQLRDGIDVCVVARGRLIDSDFEVLLKDFKSALSECNAFKD